MRGMEAEVLKVLGQVDVPKMADLQSQTALVTISGLAFLVPALVCWRQSRTWHMCMFCVLAGVCSSFQFCTTGAAEGLGVCSPWLTASLSRAHLTWAYFCLLQTALMVLGPEDPQLQTIQDGQHTSVPFKGHLRCHTPMDLVLFSRVIPFVLFCATNFACHYSTWSQVHWQNALLTELLFIACSVIFWMDPQRQIHAQSIRRFKYWHRLLHHGLIPAVMLFWVSCIIGFADHKSLQPLMHVVLAGYAISTLKAAHPDAVERPPGTEVLDTSAQNPDVSHALTGGVAIVVLPSLLVALNFDWCASAAPKWRGLAAVAACQPGGHFIAFAGTLACTAGCAAFWLIDSVSPRTPTPWAQLTRGAARPWEALRQRPSMLKDGMFGKRLGCLLGFVGSAFGLMAALAVYDSPRYDTVVLCCSLLSLSSLALALALTLWSDASAPGYRLRRFYTAFICEPLLLVNILRLLSGAAMPAFCSLPEWASASVVCATMVALALWPLTWAAEVQQGSRLKTDDVFSWPVTDWRFQ